MALPREKFLAKLHKDARKHYYSCYEDIPDGAKVYLVTWNPKPKFYNYDQYGENNFDLQWWTMCNTLLKHIRCLEHFALVPEISEQGKLHMHGFYTVKDKRKYHRSFLPTLRCAGFLKVNKVNQCKWKTFKYHVKDLKSGVTQGLMKAWVLSHLSYTILRKQYSVQHMLALKYVAIEEKKRNIATFFDELKEISEEEFSYSIEL